MWRGQGRAFADVFVPAAWFGEEPGGFFDRAARDEAARGKEAWRSRRVGMGGDGMLNGTLNWSVGA